MEQALPLRAQRVFRNPALPRADEPELATNQPSVGWTRGIPGHWQELLKWLRQFGREASLEDLTDGDRVVVWVDPRDGKPLAKWVLIMEPAAYERVKGIVLDIREVNGNGGTITIDTQAEPIYYDNHTSFTLRGTPYLEGREAIFICVENDGVLLAKRAMAPVKPAEQTD